MLGIPRRFSHFVFGVTQSGLTCAVAAAIASYPFFSEGAFLRHWLQSWAFAWILMLPVVIFAAPLIRNFVHFLTCEEKAQYIPAQENDGRENRPLVESRLS